MTKQRRVVSSHVTYIRTTGKTVDCAHHSRVHEEVLVGMNFETDWKVGSPWKLIFPDGRIADAGEIVEFDEPKAGPQMAQRIQARSAREGYAWCVIEIEPAGEVVKLTITHDLDKPDEAHRCGFHWVAKILSSLKTLLETGSALPAIGELPRG